MILNGLNKNIKCTFVVIISNICDHSSSKINQSIFRGNKVKSKPDEILIKKNQKVIIM